MKKKISLLLCTLALALGLTACGELKSSDKIAGRTVSSYREEVTEFMEVFGDTLAGDRSAFKDEISQQLQTYYGITLEDAAASFGMSVDELLDSQFKPEDYLAAKFDLDVNDEESLVTNLYKDFQECAKDAGDYKGIKDYSVEKAGKTITSTVIGDFSKRDLKMTFVYSTLDSSVPTAMNVEPVYTLGEIMKKAALNTVMGILIVFVMLVVMSAVIKGFEIIPKIEKKLKESKETAEDVRPVAAAVPVSSSNNETDDLQLVAVIAAAIAASTGASTDSFVVRSIKKR